MRKINYFYLMTLVAFVLFVNFPFIAAQSFEETARDILPDFNFNNVGLIVSLFFGVVVIAIAGGVGIYYVIRFLKFNRDVTIWEDVAGHDDLEPVGRDKAMLVKVGKGGTELLYLKKRKVYRGAYGKRVGKKNYLFVIGKDGYWYNSTLGSLDQALRQINVKPTSVNMRYQNESLVELIKQRYDKPSFWSQYGQVIVNLIFFLLVAVMFWLYFDTFKETAPAMKAAADALVQAANAFKEGVGGLDTIRGSGGFIST